MLTLYLRLSLSRLADYDEQHRNPRVERCGVLERVKITLHTILNLGEMAKNHHFYGVDVENKFLALWFITTTKLPEIRYYQSLCITSFDKKRYLQNKNKTVLWSVAFPFHHILLLTKKFPHFCIPPLSFYFSSIAAKFTLQFLESC